MSDAGRAKSDHAVVSADTGDRIITALFYHAAHFIEPPRGTSPAARTRTALAILPAPGISVGQQVQHQRLLFVFHGGKMADTLRQKLSHPCALSNEPASTAFRRVLTGDRAIPTVAAS
jgi:hypothetical protein